MTLSDLALSKARACNRLTCARDRVAARYWAVELNWMICAPVRASPSYDRGILRDPGRVRFTPGSSHNKAGQRLAQSPGSGCCSIPGMPWLVPYS